MSEIVKKIVEELFTNGQGEKANRLVMEFDKHIKGCGWGKPAVRSIISDAINDGSQVNTLVIKPCPFCGSKKIRVWEKSDNYWNIQCDDEDAVCAAMIYDHESKQMAIEHWNKRVL